jgi:hypothetical protein
MVNRDATERLAYRQELRETIEEEMLALLDANLPKTIQESCVDMGVPLPHLEMATCNIMEIALYRVARARNTNWSRKQDAPRCFVPNAVVEGEYRIGVDAALCWADGALHCSTLVPENLECAAFTEEEEELDIF